MSFLTYLRLKATITVLRLLTPSPPPPNPDHYSLLHIPSRDSKRTVTAHVYRSTSSSASAPTPVLINAHGSGFVLPLHASDAHFCHVIATSSPYTVIDIAYRLAPEYPYPAAVEDVEDVLAYVFSRPKEFDQDKVSVSGFSAGGNLVLAAAMGETKGEGKIESLIAVYPPADLSIDPGEKRQPDESGKGVIPVALARLFDECYLQGQEAGQVGVSVGLGDVKRLPERVMLVTCAWDYLAPETERLADRIEKEAPEKHLVRKMVPGVPHAWDKNTKPGSDGEKKRDEVYQMAVDFLNRK